MTYVSRTLYAGNNLFNSVMQSRINLVSTPLHRMHSEQRVKSVVVPSLLHLLATIEFIKLATTGEKVLVVFEGLSTLFLAHKVILPIIQYSGSEIVH